MRPDAAGMLSTSAGGARTTAEIRDHGAYYASPLYCRHRQGHQHRCAQVLLRLIGCADQTCTAPKPERCLLAAFLGRAEDRNPFSVSYTHEPMNWGNVCCSYYCSFFVVGVVVVVVAAAAAVAAVAAVVAVVAVAAVAVAVAVAWDCDCHFHCHCHWQW